MGSYRDQRERERRRPCERSEQGRIVGAVEVSVGSRDERSEERRHFDEFPLRRIFWARIVSVRIVAIAAMGHDSHEYDPLSDDIVAAGPVS